MANESQLRTITVALVLSVVCSVALAAAVTLLKPIQLANQALDKQRKILAAAGVLAEGEGDATEVGAKFQKFERYLVDLNTGAYSRIELDDRYDQRKATKQADSSMALSGEQDVADVRRRAEKADVYLLRDEQGQLSRLVLPVSGYGLWSTMYGYLVLEKDANTVAGITFTDQAETPGLGGEVDNPKWQAQWVGKQVYDDSGKAALHLKKGGVDASKPEASYQIDALSGATLTSNGVSNMLEFWMGDLGFKQFLSKVRESGV
ncbi:MAG: Na(+)-translocating NADH-quinone reductase subunit C [Paraperlucidibaca sp.]